MLLLPLHCCRDALMLPSSVASPKVKRGETMRGENRVLICEEGEERGYRERDSDKTSVN